MQVFGVVFTVVCFCVVFSVEADVVEAAVPETENQLMSVKFNKQTYSRALPLAVDGSTLTT